MEDSAPLSPLTALEGQSVLITGTTGFLAKIMLGMLLERFRPRKIFLLIRSTKSRPAELRFQEEVLDSDMMAPLRQRFGPDFRDIVLGQVEIVAGDIALPNLGLSEADQARLCAEVDLIINSAGLVSFNPPLDSAIDVNTVGAHEAAQFALRLKKPRLVHISTCYVAGKRSGRVPEDADLLGRFPRQDDYPGTTFDWAREVADLRQLIAQTKARTKDAALEAQFRKEGLERLRREGRDKSDRALRAAITNQRRRWQAEELIRLGLERAAHWGWPNIYTFSKALGEQAIAATEGLDWCIVRPAIVESALAYPFPGWNEGMNTSAPLAYMGLHGQVLFPGDDDLILDVIPVDYVSSATLAAAAALVEGEARRVYQVAAGDVNPCSMARVVNLVGLYRRRKIRQEKAEGTRSAWSAQVARLASPIPRARKQYETLGAPALHRGVEASRRFLDELAPERFGPFADLIQQVKDKTQAAEGELKKVVDAFDLFMPFIWENRYIFSTAQTRNLFARMNDADRALLGYEPETLSWRQYWLDVHLPGLERWVFPKLESSGPKRKPIPRDYRDLLELFDSRTREHGRRVAYRILREGDVADSYTYQDVRRAAGACAEFLHQQGVDRGDRVLLLSEGRPEWGSAYFGILAAGATAVPVDIDLSADEIACIAGTAKAKGTIFSPRQAEKLEGVPGASWPLPAVFAEADAKEPPRLPSIKRKPEDVASIIFTSGTTGTPKGVVLTDRNFTALTARLSALFSLHPNDGLLSVLPPHHTFEFSVGLLMPLAAGASVTYLEERSPDLIARAFEETPVTALVGVPALWESLHRKIKRGIDDTAPAARALVRGLMRTNRALRDRSPYNLGRFIFRPMHNAFGGRMRFLISGGAPLPKEIYEDLRSLGFNIYEGYGLTEAAPVLTVGWPREKNPVGSVGWPLPGIDVRIKDPDADGVGEVIARGPTIMSGYLDQPEATAEALKDGWLHTGDRGRLDEDGHLFIVGRDKDVIIDSNGKNIYPDEVEDHYRQHPWLKEISVVGLPAANGRGERIAALVVPDYEAEDAPARERVRAALREHIQAESAKLPVPRRLKVFHFWDAELPRTSTRKVKRDFVRDTLARMEARSKPNDTAAPNQQAEAWLSQTIGEIAATDRKITGPTRLVEDLGFDSIMQLELLSAIEAAYPGIDVPQDEFAQTETVAEVEALLRRSRGRPSTDTRTPVRAAVDEPVKVPKVVARAGKAFLGWCQRAAYEHGFEVDVRGQGNIPANRNFIVVANHTSHLDMGLVKHALGPLGRDILTLAARDYFFDDAWRRAYFENFTNLLPIDRHGSLKKSLRRAKEALANGESLLIFPEGTRARDGEMAPFKPAVGHLCLSEAVDILPLYLGGTHDALPVGGARPKQRALWVSIGAPLTVEVMRRETAGMARAEAYRHVAARAEAVVRRLGGLSTPPAAERRAPTNGRPLSGNGASARDDRAQRPTEHRGPSGHEEQEQTQ